MLTIVKEFLYTFNGKDCRLVLVHDDCITTGIPCDYCFYRDYEPDSEILEDCCTVHDCSVDFDTYFTLFELYKNSPI